MQSAGITPEQRGGDADNETFSFTKGKSERLGIECKNEIENKRPI